MHSDSQRLAEFVVRAYVRATGARLSEDEIRKAALEIAGGGDVLPMALAAASTITHQAASGRLFH